MKRKALKTAAVSSVVVFIVGFVLAVLGAFLPVTVRAEGKTTYTRQGDTVWFGSYPQSKATDEELASMSATPDENGFYTSGKDKFVKVSSADPKFHSETADTDYIPFDDGSQPVVGATYYFKMEPVEWKVMVDDANANAVKLVSKKYLDTHVWLSTENVQEITHGRTYYNVADGVPAETPANGWRYSEMRAWLNDGFYNEAFTEEEQKSIYLFVNKNTIDYRKDDESTVVNDYIAIGDRSDYDAAGDDGRPTDYAIVKGATWCYNKDHIYYWVNDSFQTFGSDTVRLYRHDEHEKCNRVDCVEAVRPILYAKRDDAKILATATQKEEKQANLLLIFGIIAAVVGAVSAIPVMIVTRARYKKLPPEQQKGKFPYKKYEVPRIAVGLVLLIGGLLMIFLPIMINGGFGAKLQPGIYVQDFTEAQQGNVAFVGQSAYRLNADGTYNYAAVYDGDSTVWDIGGTWKQSGSTLTLTGKPNPLYPSGYTVTATVYGSDKFGKSAQNVFKRID